MDSQLFCPLSEQGVGEGPGVEKGFHRVAEGLSALVKRRFNEQEEALFVPEIRYSRGDKADHCALYFRRRVEALFMYFEQVFYPEKSLDQYAEHTIGLGTFFGSHPLGHFFLEHARYRTDVSFPIQQLKQDL